MSLNRPCWTIARENPKNFDFPSCQYFVLNMRTSSRPLFIKTIFFIYKKITLKYNCPARSIETQLTFKISSRSTLNFKNST